MCLTSVAQVIYLLHSVGASRCLSRLAVCSDGCLNDGLFNGVPVYHKPLVRSRWVMDQLLELAQINQAIQWQSIHQPHLRGTGRVLCLDGGGIKGLVLTQQLFVLEKALGRPIHECFDWICGTSTGGFLALMLSLGQSVKAVQTLYYSLKEKVFVGNRPYDSGPLEEVLRKQFGEEATMSSIKGLKVMVTSTLADRLPPDLHLFRNYDSPMQVIGLPESTHFNAPKPPNKQKIWLAARSSGAAPTYFSSLDQFVDGGMIANNPTLDMLTEIEEWNMAVRSKGRHDEIFVPTVVVSLGCGKAPLSKVENIDVVVPSLLDMRRGLQAVYNLFNLLVDSACPSQGRVVDRARAWCSALNVPFFRLNPQLSADISLDESSDEKLLRIMWEARAELQRNSKMVDHLKYLLIPATAEDKALPVLQTSQTSFESTDSVGDGSITDKYFTCSNETSPSSLVKKNSYIIQDGSSQTSCSDRTPCNTIIVSGSQDTDLSSFHGNVSGFNDGSNKHTRKGSDVSIGFEPLSSSNVSERDGAGFDGGLTSGTSLIPQLSVPNLVELLTRSGVDPHLLANSMPDVLNSLHKSHEGQTDALRASSSRCSPCSDLSSAPSSSRSSRSRPPYKISDPPGYPYFVNDEDPNPNDFLPVNLLNPIVSSDTDSARTDDALLSGVGLGFCPDSPASIRSLRLSVEQINDSDGTNSGTAPASFVSTGNVPNVSGALASSEDGSFPSVALAVNHQPSEVCDDGDDHLPSYHWAVENA